MIQKTAIKAAVSLCFFGLIGVAWWHNRRPPEASARDTRNDFGFDLKETAREHGVQFTHHPPRLDPRLENVRPHVAGMGAAVSVSDVNGDGWPDFYATNSDFDAPNALFVNQKDGTFRDVASAAGVADVNRAGRGVSMGSVFGDFDNDGDEDLFIYKWGYSQLLRNEGDLTFADVTAASGLERWMNANSAVWLDYDRDGLLDLFVAGYFRDDIDLWNLQTTKIMQESFEFANNGGHKYLYRNAGGGRFEDVTARTGVESTRWTLAVASADLDGDGWQDLYLANDYGPEELFLNRQGVRFERMSNVGLDESSKSGMSVTLGDFQNEGRLGVYVTNITKSPFLIQGNNLRVNRLADRGWLQNVADGQVADCGWSWGAQFGDLNNDGQLDLYVLNGFVSASKEHDYWYGMGKVAGAMGALAADATNWPPMEDRSLSGYERSRVLVNRGRGRFVDAAESVGASDLFDGRAVALADLFNRGKLDVLVANQKGPLLLYENNVDPSRHWIQFQLIGSKSNKSAIGTQVTLHSGEMITAQCVQGGSGFCSQNDRRLHFGLGAHAGVEQAVIHWTSGAVQVIEHPAADTLHRIEEP